MARPHGCCQTADRWFHGLHASKKSRQSRLFRPMPPLQNRPAAVDKRRFLKDSASTMADMIPLPTPARLGLLRFERLNDPGWPLLYLDSACDAELGLPAAGLCTPAGDNYASLISEAVRLQQHQVIQQQLAGGHHSYRIRYLLQGPQGVLDILETGERYYQAGQELLHGYLLAMPGLERPADMLQHPPTRQQPEADRARCQALLDSLYRKPTGSLDALAETLTAALPGLYQVRHASLWLLEPLQLRCLAEDGQSVPEMAATQPLQEMPRHLHALRQERQLELNDVRQAADRSELAGYFSQRQTAAVLDAGIRVQGQLAGVLRLEQDRFPREWSAGEIAFISELAEALGQNILGRQYTRTSHALQLFQQAVEQSSSAFLLLDREGRVEYASSGFTRITQYQPEDVQGQLITELPALEDISDLLQDARTALSRRRSWQSGFRGRRKNLLPYWGQLSVSRVFDHRQRLSNYIVIYEDITENRLAQQQIERLSCTDSLTGLVNRGSFIRTLEERFSQEDSPKLVLVLVDIDNFKRINDSLGHRTGDRLLVKLARRLTNALEARGQVSRFASNEFAILIEGMALDDGLQLARQLLKSLDKPLYIDGQLISISGSAGLAASPQHGFDPQTLMKHAGLALHKAKANGKSQVQTFTATLNTEADFRLFLENSLRRALVQEELELFYQPKVCLMSGRLLGLEALLRWNHPEKGMIQPVHFISVAEETGQIIPIGKWAARQACRMGRRLSEQGFTGLSVAINLSPRQFADPALVSTLQDILAEEQLPPACLELELTESLLLDATEQTHQQLNQLKEMGLTLSMDDFGTGYSSLSYLKKFPIDVIKIDRSFVKDIPDNQDDMEITSAVIAMAHNLKLKVVAEGIETQQQLTFLRRHRCDIGQGYLFDRPIPASQLPGRLQHYRFQPG